MSFVCFIIFALPIIFTIMIAYFECSLLDLGVGFTVRKVPCPLVGNAYKMAMKFVISATFHT